MKTDERGNLCLSEDIATLQLHGRQKIKRMPGKKTILLATQSSWRELCKKYGEGLRLGRRTGRRHSSLRSMLIK